MKKVLLATLLLTAAYLADAQVRPREDDHFWRKRVVMSIDLDEKVNKPLKESEYDNSNYEVGKNKKYGVSTRGMIYALLRGFEENKYPGYNPDSLHRTLSLADFQKRYQKKTSGAATPAAGSTETGTEEGLDGEGLGDEEGLGEDDGLGDDFAAEGADVAGGAATTKKAEVLYEGLDRLLEIVEDRIFDKVRSDMVYDIQYIRIYFIDPFGNDALNQSMIAFRYSDVKEALDGAQWKNPANDAENRSLKEIMELRLFRGFVTAMSSSRPNSLYESDLRSQQMLEFEHNLWSY